MLCLHSQLQPDSFRFHATRCIYWGVNGGASCHATPWSNCALQVKRFCFYGDEELCYFKIIKEGEVWVETKVISHRLILKDVRFVPELWMYLISIGKLDGDAIIVILEKSIYQGPDGGKREAVLCCIGHNWICSRAEWTLAERILHQACNINKAIIYWFEDSTRCLL